MIETASTYLRTAIDLIVIAATLGALNYLTGEPWSWAQLYQAVAVLALINTNRLLIRGKRS